MPCYHPLIARYDQNGQVRIKAKKSLDDWSRLELQGAGYFNIPCGKCIGCRLRYSREWAIRMTHEAQMHENNCFITLTFNPESLAARGHNGLDKTEFQKFMKRLRKHLGQIEVDKIKTEKWYLELPGRGEGYTKADARKEARKKAPKVRFFHCGEYGEKNGRPHYHAILFGYDFSDKVYLTTVGGHIYWHSPMLRKIWDYGHNVVAGVSFESCAYTARYITKKQTGEGTDEFYTDPETGEVYLREYCTQSRHPGIGATWYEKHGMSDVHNNDYIVPMDKPNLKMRPPRYYDKLLNDKNPELFEQIKEARAARAPEPILEYEERLDRLWVSEECKEIKGQRFERDPEKVRF